nr:MAG TPA: hypothetical protein [Caudoviricetes sp.]
MFPRYSYRTSLLLATPAGHRAHMVGKRRPCSKANHRFT